MADGEQLNFLGKMMLILEKYGIAKTLGAIGVIAIFVWALNSESFINRVINEAFDQQIARTQKVEEENWNQRETGALDIYEILHDLIDDTGADRAYIFEMHNGTENTSGLPFMYANMNYEEVKHNIRPVAMDWQNVSLTLYPFAFNIKRNGYWDGSIKTLSEIDYKMSLRLEIDDVKYIYVTALYGSRGNCLGILGISYLNRNEPEDIALTRHSMMATGQSISILLDTNYSSTE